MAGSAQEKPRPREPSRDRGLVAALRAGDEQTFAGLVDTWASSMLRLAREFVPTDSAAEEVVQETWLAVVTGLEGFRGDASFRTWVYRILVNQAKSRGVRERRTVPLTSLVPEDTGETVAAERFQGPDGEYPGHWRASPPPWPEEVTLSHEVRDVVTAALRTLPPRQRVVVALRDLDGYDAAEVSALLGITGGNQRVLLHRGRAVVRAHLDRYFSGAAVEEVGGR
jgi:RNA polymerase sigma-70 factor (ECF subfamily)